MCVGFYARRSKSFDHREELLSRRDLSEPQARHIPFDRKRGFDRDSFSAPQDRTQVIRIHTPGCLSAFRAQNRQICGTRWFLLNAARFPAGAVSQSLRCAVPVPHRPVSGCLAACVLLVTRIVPAEADCGFKAPLTPRLVRPCAALNDFQFSVCAEQFGFMLPDPPSCRRCLRCRHRTRRCRPNRLRCHRRLRCRHRNRRYRRCHTIIITGILIAGVGIRRAAVRIAVIFFIVVVIIIHMVLSNPCFSRYSDDCRSRSEPCPSRIGRLQHVPQRGTHRMPADRYPYSR